MGAASDFDVILSTLLAEDQNLGNWTIVLPPLIFANLANMIQLAYGTEGAPLGNKFTRDGGDVQVFGMNVMCSPNVTVATTDMDSGGGTENHNIEGYLVHKSALSIAFSKSVNIKTDYSIDYLGTKMVADVMYGILVRNSATEGQQRVHFLS